MSAPDPQPRSGRGPARSPTPPAPDVRPRLVLASASPARLALLRGAGIEPEVVVSGVIEDGVTADSPAELALVLASAKAVAVARHRPGALVLGCDSVLELDGEALGKPSSAEDASARWRRMRGRTGVLHTGHALLGSGGEARAVASTQVHFGTLSDAEIDAYVATGEPLKVAGAFTIDGLGGPFVERVEGDWSNVVGLSLPLLRRLLAEVGVALPSLWTALASRPA